jgi:hypothetical protein
LFGVRCQCGSLLLLYVLVMTPHNFAPSLMLPLMGFTECINQA